jgi:hypothetical protein
MKNEPKRMLVRERKALHFPPEIANSARLNATGEARPYIVDWTDPIERMLCKGQEYKLGAAPDDSVPTPITCKPAITNIKRIRGELPDPAPKTAVDQIAENSASAPAPQQSELPGVSARPTKKKTSKKATAKRPSGPEVAQ